MLKINIYTNGSNYHYFFVLLGRKSPDFCFEEGDGFSSVDDASRRKTWTFINVADNDDKELDDSVPVYERVKEKIL